MLNGYTKGNEVNEKYENNVPQKSSKKKTKKKDWTIASTFKGVQSKPIFKQFCRMPSSVSILLGNGSF